MKTTNIIFKTDLGKRIMFIEVPTDAVNFKTSMGYLLFKVPDYSTWVGEDVLADISKLDKYLETSSGKSEYIPSAIKIDCDGTVLGEYSPKTKLFQSVENGSALENEAYDFINYEAKKMKDSKRILVLQINKP